jgi:hypothetical protein
MESDDKKHPISRMALTSNDPSFRGKELAFFDLCCAVGHAQCPQFWADKRLALSHFFWLLLSGTS